MRTQLPFALLAAALTCSLFAAPAQAQRARVFVASYGNDSNPCTFGSPCKTFQNAFNNVAVGGEITAIDSAGFGSLNITHAITITSPAGIEAGIVPIAGADAIDINAGSNDELNLRGLTIEGAGIGAAGIKFNIGQSLVAKTMRPVLQALAVEHHTMTRLDEVEFIVDRSITQAVATQAPCVFILSPLLTGGKIFAK